MSDVPAEADSLGDALAELLFRLIGSLSRLQHAGRKLHPESAFSLGAQLADAAAELTRALERIEPMEWPKERQLDGERILEAARVTRIAMLDFAQHSTDPRSIFELYRALRSRTAALELLFPLCSELPAVSNFFSVESELSEENAGKWRRRSASERGITHVENAPDQRGGFSVYSPFPADHMGPHPLVVALHGGSGHGRDFLWTWIPAARSRGAVVVAPTSLDRTWSLMQPEVDRKNLETIVQAVTARFPIDQRHFMLTGMSDGGTFTLQCGLSEESPFSHLAPISGVLPPLLPSQRACIHGRKIHLVHGALDWMFPVETAHMAAEELKGSGADLVYTEIEDLSHTYPSEFNGPLLEWLDPALKAEP